VSVLVTAMFAYGVSKRYVVGTRTLNVLMVFTLFFGGGLIPTYLLLVQLGLIRTFWAMILPFVLNTGHFIIMRNFFSYSVPAELEDAALIDGSTEFRTFFLVVMPLSKAMIAAIFLFEAVFHWNDYYSFLMFVREPKLMPFVSLLQRVLEDPIYTLRSASGQMYVEEEGLPPPKQLVMTTIVLAMAPIMMLYPFLQRHFAKGILIGAVKE
jgi:ABC-type glycerol-3-phosphate transport system permease component